MKYAIRFLAAIVVFTLGVAIAVWEIGKMCYLYILYGKQMKKEKYITVTVEGLKALELSNHLFEVRSVDRVNRGAISRIYILTSDGLTVSYSYNGEVIGEVEFLGIGHMRYVCINPKETCPEMDILLKMHAEGKQ